MEGAFETSYGQYSGDGLQFRFIQKAQYYWRKNHASLYNQFCRMPLEIEISEVSPVQVVTLRGRLDSAGAPSFESSMEQLIAGGALRILLDCSDLRYVSSVGLGLFVASSKALQAKGGGLYFASLTQSVRSVFEMVGFLGLFLVFSSVGDALQHPELSGS